MSKQFLRNFDTGFIAGGVTAFFVVKAFSPSGGPKPFGVPVTDEEYLTESVSPVLAPTLKRIMAAKPADVAAFAVEDIKAHPLALAGTPSKAPSHLPQNLFVNFHQVVLSLHKTECPTNS